jgi:hypothetical protein
MISTQEFEVNGIEPCLATSLPCLTKDLLTVYEGGQEAI